MKLNWAKVAEAGDFRNLWTDTHMSGIAGNLDVLEIEGCKVEMGSDRYFLKGVTLKSTDTAITIDINIPSWGEYIHLNFHNDPHVVLGKHAKKSAGTKAKGTMYLRMDKLQGTRVALAASNKDYVDGNLVNVDSCDHTKKDLIKSDVGKILYHLFNGCFEPV